MEIITNGINTTKFVFKCEHCFCEFKANYNELHEPNGLKASRFFIFCPECKTFISTINKETVKEI